MNDNTPLTWHPLTWHIAGVAPSAERKAVRGLRENGFTVVQPCMTVWKSAPKKPRERVKSPLFPGYLFIGQGPDTPLDRIHDDRTPVRLMRHRWPERSLSALVCDFAFRELAGEFDRTGDDHYVPSKPISGPLTRSLGSGLSCLKALLSTDDNGRLRLLTSGEMIGAGPLEEECDEAA